MYSYLSLISKEDVEVLLLRGSDGKVEHRYNKYRIVHSDLHSDIELLTRGFNVGKLLL